MIRRWKALHAEQNGPEREHGYVAVMTAILLLVLMSMAAFAVDVGRWYVVGQQEQRAVDAAALAGVTSLPADLAGATTAAQKFTKLNGFENGVNATTVTAGLDGRPTRLRVTVSRTVNNVFGQLLGVPTTKVSRTAVTDFGGPVPMGSPCNAFGNDPEPGTNQGTACSDVTGQMWANVNSYSSAKSNGDAYQSNTGCSGSVDGCTGSTNNDYTANGYFYTVSVKAAMPSLTIQLFDPVWVDTGLTCDASTTGSGGVTTNFGGGNGTTPPPLATTALNDAITDEATRYKPGSAEPYCTGDATFGGSTVMKTQFTVRDPGTATPWDPTSFPVHAGCQTTYPGYTGNLFDVLDQYTTGTTPNPSYNKDSSGTTTNPTIVDGFRRWTTLCTIANPPIGDYLVQVKTSGLGTDAANATNHFAIRAYGANLGENNSISIAGREKMGMFSNKPGATNEFHLARVPTGAAGQMLRLSLFDVGDSTQTGTIYIQYPPSAVGGPFTGCQGSGPASGPLTNCSFQAIYSGGVSDHQGKWQVVSVPIPANYSCDDADPRACWVRLKYDYGAGSAPHDVTAWAASIDGDPVRLVE